MLPAEISKLDAVESQLEAAAYLMLRSFPPEPVHTLIGAARGILYALSKHAPNKVLEKWDTSILQKVVGGGGKEIRHFQNLIANFLKHADRDPEDTLSAPDLNGLNELELTLCISAFNVLRPTLTPRLNLSALYLSLVDGALVSFDQLLPYIVATSPASLPADKLASLGGLSAPELRSIAVEIFEKV